MNRSADEQVKQLLQTKFQDFEMRGDWDDDRVWDTIQTAVNASRSSISTIDIAVLSGIIALVLGLSFYGDLLKPEERSSFPQNIAKGGQAIIQEKEAEDSSEVIISRPQQSQFGSENLDELETYTSPKLLVPEPGRTLVDDAKNSDVHTPPIYPTFVSQSRLESKNSRLHTARPPSLEVVPPLSNSENKKPRRFGIEISNGLTLNYLRLQPNSRDTIFIKDQDNEFNLTSHRIGFQPMITFKFPLGPRIRLNTTALFTYRKYKVNIAYQSFISDGENNGGADIDESFYFLSTGVSAGISYALFSGIQDKSIDIWMGYERMINDPLKEQMVLGFPSDLFTINLGASFYFYSRATHRWIVRPYGSYPLNNKFSTSPLQLTPFSFGVVLGLEF